MGGNSNRLVGGGTMLTNVVGGFAAFLGHFLRFLLGLGVFVFRLAGPACVCVALAAVDWRLGLGAAGVFLILIERRV